MFKNFLRGFFRRPVPSIYFLPNELLLQIAECLCNFEDLYSLILTCRRFAGLLTPLFFGHTATNSFPMPRRIAKSFLQRSVLHWAVAHGNTNLVKTLFRHGAGTSSINNALDARGVAPLHSAVLSGHEELTKLLLDNGADREVLLAKRTSLHLAIACRTPNIVRILLEHGANIETRWPEDYLTPLQHAIAWGDAVMVRMLLDAGANVYAPCRLGTHVSVYTSAIGHWQGEIGALLRAHGSTARELSPKLRWWMLAKHASTTRHKVALIRYLRAYEFDYCAVCLNRHRS
jgi:hypothetical protein